MLELTPRSPVDLHGLLPAGQRALFRLEAAVNASDLDPVLLELVKIRASQLNGCAFCLELHHHDAREAGEAQDRLDLVSAWRETDRFTHPERVALALTEALTLVASGHPSPELEAEARTTFGDETYAALAFAIVAINAWNRIAILGHTVPAYRPPKA